MFDSKRLLTIGSQVALMGAALLLLVMSFSTGRTSEIGSRLSGQVLRQAIGFRAQSLRRPTNAQTRASKLERSDTASDRAPASDVVSTDCACLHAQQQLALPTYRLIATYRLRDIESLRLLVAFDVERARAPPTVNTARSNSSQRI